MVNRYLQAWDAHNLFIQGASVFPQQHGYNPTGTVGALAYWSAQRDHDEAISKIRDRSFTRERRPGNHGRDMRKLKNPGLRRTCASRAVAAVLSRPCRTRPCAADAAHGKVVFQTCAACHSDKPDAIGPSLRGVYGRKSGSLDDFRYSNAMMRANLDLGRSQSARLHQGPAGQGEGQSHAVRRASSDPKDIDDVIAYLKDYK